MSKFYTIENIINSTDEPILKLGTAILFQAIEDYKRALEVIIEYNYDIKYLYTNGTENDLKKYNYKVDCEKFFKSRWFNDLVINSKIDGEHLYEILQQELNFDEDRYLNNLNKFLKELKGDN